MFDIKFISIFTELHKIRLAHLIKFIYLGNHTVNIRGIREQTTFGCTYNFLAFAI